LINKEDNLAYYIQIYNILKKRIEDRIYPPNGLLPSENELAEEFNVTRITVRNAIKRLKEEDRIYTEKGKGSFVKISSVEQSLFKFYSFGRNYTKKDFQTETIVIDASIGICDEEIKNMLKLSTSQDIVKIIRLRKMGQSPVILEFSYMPYILVPNILQFDLAYSSIYDLLEEKFELKISRAKEYLSPCVTSVYESALLEVEEKTPVFITERITYTQGDVPIEVRKSIVRSDKFKFFVDL
jgi:GntR family transcriptional regulator